MFYDALRNKNFEKTLNAFIAKWYFENGNQDYHFDDFDRIYRVWVKKYYLVNQENIFFLILFSIYLRKTDEKWDQNFQKNYLPKKKKKQTPSGSLLWLF